MFQFEKDNFSGDAQLINSVYLDNQHMELYHGRLDKRPNAIALRIRCITIQRFPKIHSQQHDIFHIVAFGVQPISQKVLRCTL